MVEKNAMSLTTMRQKNAIKEDVPTIPTIPTRPTIVQVLNLNLPAVPPNYVKFYLDHFSLNNVS